MLGDPTRSADEPRLILIANDQEWTSRAVESILAANGYQVVRASTALQAMDLLETHQPDLLILDLQLPDYSGTELCRRLRADPRFGQFLPVIITTAGPSGREQRLAAYQAGAWEFYG
ncbi:MAG: response regulator, partial [Gemmatimonadales bacterium]